MEEVLILIDNLRKETELNRQKEEQDNKAYLALVSWCFKRLEITKNKQKGVAIRLSEQKWRIN
jgi:hypothetical protein